MHEKELKQILVGIVFQKNICSVIMPIGMDHLDFLKKGTIDEIIYEKCSCLLGGSKIFISKQKSNVLEKIKKNISRNSSEKFIFGKDYDYEKNTNGFIYEDKMGKMNLPLPNLSGDFQINNVFNISGTWPSHFEKTVDMQLDNLTWHAHISV